MNKNELDIQLALGTLSYEIIIEEIRSTPGPEFLKELARAAYLVFGNWPQIESGGIEAAFINNPHTPKEIKSYIKVADQMLLDNDYYLAGLEEFNALKEKLFYRDPQEGQ